MGGAGLVGHQEEMDRLRSAVGGASQRLTVVGSDDVCGRETITESVSIFAFSVARTGRVKEEEARAKRLLSGTGGANV